ncbi:MAG: hypothetical protein ACYC7E_11255 [Armatimonadota bacterium]
MDNDREYRLTLQAERAFKALADEYTACPDSDDFLKYVNLQPPTIGEDALVAHLAQCSACRNIFVTLVHEFQTIHRLHRLFYGWLGAWLDSTSRFADEETELHWDVHKSFCLSCRRKSMAASWVISHCFPWLRKDATDNTQGSPTKPKSFIQKRGLVFALACALMLVVCVFGYHRFVGTRVVPSHPIFMGNLGNVMFGVVFVDISTQDQSAITEILTTTYASMRIHPSLTREQRRQLVPLLASVPAGAVIGQQEQGIVWMAGCQYMLIFSRARDQIRLTEINSSGKVIVNRPISVSQIRQEFRYNHKGR